ncbi:MAG: hypothetical protein U0S36_10170 [Candidatus Nanopelagicales bacterium]
MRSYGEVIDVRTARPSARSSGGGGSGTGIDTGIGTAADVRPAGAPSSSSGADGSTSSATCSPTGSSSGRGGSRPAVPSRHPSGERGGEGARSVAADVGAVEREVWQVEAAPGRSAAAGVFDLVRDVPAVAPAGRASDGTAYDHEPDDPGAPGMSPGGHRPDAPQRWRLARALD